MSTSQIQQVRSFNRAVTRCIGALEYSYLSRGRPLGEARVLFEIGMGQTDIRAIRDRLGLDSGYLSRLLKSLEAQALIRLREDDNDHRRRSVRLTAKGLAEVAAYDDLSDRLAEKLLDPLTPRQRERLVDAMASVERLLRAASVEMRVAAPESDAGRWCLGEYYREISERFDAGFDPANGNMVTDAEMRPPAGSLVLAWLDGSPVGCGVLKLGDGRTGEIKRMWTAPAARGLGIARRMIHTLETMARDAGLKKIQLDTNKALTEAQALYRKEGYTETGRYNSNPYAHHWFEKTL
jgi:DNA-binding MarR family transcriptional regulator/GNAT superfamily N-acetyltransferase